MWHARVRAELGFGGEDDADMDALIAQAGLPRLALLLRLPGLPRRRAAGGARRPARARTRIGVELSEEFQLHPEQSTSALIVHHPEAKYFNAT